MELFQKQCEERIQASEKERKATVDKYKKVYGERQEKMKENDVYKREVKTLHKEIDRQISMKTDEKKSISRDSLYHGALQTQSDLEFKVRNLEHEKLQTLELLLNYETVMKHVFHKIPQDALEKLDGNLFAMLKRFSEAVKEPIDREEALDNVPHTALVKGMSPERLIERLKIRLNDQDFANIATTDTDGEDLDGEGNILKSSGESSADGSDAEQQ